MAKARIKKNLKRVFKTRSEAEEFATQEYPLHKIHSDPNIAAMVAEGGIPTRFGLQEGAVRLISNHLKHILPAGTGVKTIQKIVSDNLQPGQLMAISLAGEGLKGAAKKKAQRAAIWEALFGSREQSMGMSPAQAYGKRSESSRSLAGMLFQGFMRPQSDVVQFGGKTPPGVDWPHMSNQEMRRRFIAGESMRAGAKIPLQENYDEARERAMTGILRKRAEGRKGSPAYEKAKGKGARSEKAIREAVKKIKKYLPNKSREAILAGDFNERELRTLQGLSSLRGGDPSMVLQIARETQGGAPTRKLKGPKKLNRKVSEAEIEKYLAENPAYVDASKPVTQSLSDEALSLLQMIDPAQTGAVKRGYVSRMANSPKSLMAGILANTLLGDQVYGSE